MTNGRLTNVLITGGTGFVGKAVLARLVEVPTYGKIYLLVRGKRDQSAEERVAGIVKRMFPPHKAERMLEKIKAIPGDLTSPRLGLTDESIELLKGEVHQLLHVGASTDFGAPIAESRLNNVEGTRHALDVAVTLSEQGVLKRFDYVSTAYVAGRKPGVCDEDTLDRAQEFSNNYEKSKFEAEVLVREYRSRLSIAIYRPSIVVGDSNSGYTPHFKVLYWPLLLLAKNLLPFFACNERAHLDVVPVDYVADGIVALMQRESSLGKTYHLTAGFGHEIKIATILRDAYQLAGIKKRPIVPYWIFNVIKKTPLRRLFPQTFWDAVDMALPYHHYLLGTSVRFDSERTRSVLGPLGIHPPGWDEYKKDVLGFCLASRWGKKLPMPEYIYYLPVASRKELGREYARGEHQAKVGGGFGVTVGQNA